VQESDAHEHVKDLLREIRNQAGWEAGAQIGFKDGWFARALSAVALLAAADTPKYVTGAYDREAGGGVVHAFYERSVVTIAITGARAADPKLSVTSRSRAGLRVLEVDATAPLGAGSTWEQGSWPGQVQVVATYTDGHTFVLPVTQVNYDTHRDGLIEFLPSLKADLES
jgi:hypothetical protein